MLRGIRLDAESSRSRETAITQTGTTAWMSASRPRPGSRSWISPTSWPGPIVVEKPGRSTRRLVDHEEEVVPGLADAHERLAVGELALLAEREDRVEELARELREHARIVDQALVASTVEEERPAMAVAGELDLAEEPEEE